MLRSLRFRLADVFLAGVVLAGVVASVIAVGLFQDYTRDQTIAELRREAKGLAALYAGSAARYEEPLEYKTLEEATGDKLFLAVFGPIEFPGEEPTGIAEIPRLPPDTVPRAATQAGEDITFEFTPPGETRTFLAVATPIEILGETFGALVVATPKGELRNEWVKLFQRLALAFLVGVAIAGALGLYISRRITSPVLALSRAADDIARGRYDVAVPAGGGDEVGQLAERFNDMAARLRETEELERNFLMSVSHELRTPLTAIAGHVAALREGVVEDPELRAESLEVVAAETGRLERLVGDILDLAKLDAHRFTVHEHEVDMQRLVERAYAGFTEEARRRAIEFRQQVRAQPIIETDGDRVLQIISNLLANAFRWTPDGGRIDLELTAANGSVSVAVGDTGPGIAPHERDRIFRPFWSRDGGGTGLGLAIANELAEALGGRIRLDSQEGRGSRFELVLPAGTAAKA